MISQFLVDPTTDSGVRYKVLCLINSHAKDWDDECGWMEDAIESFIGSHPHG